jgi:hypothetical protein
VPLKRLKVGPTGVEAEWELQSERILKSLPEGEVAQAKDVSSQAQPEAVGSFAQAMLDLARSASPIAAIVACEQQVGERLRAILTDAGVTGIPPLNVSGLAHLAHKKGLINDATLNAIDGLVVMHSLALLEDGGRSLDLTKAHEYIGLTEAVLYALRLNSP